MERINFKKERDLGAILQDSAQFIRQNFLKIMKPTIAAVIVPVLIGTFLMVNGMRDAFNLSEGAIVDNPLAVYSSMMGLIPAYFLYFLSAIIAYIFFVGYIKLYASGQEEISFSDLFEIFKSKILMLFFSSIVLVFIIYIGLFLCGIPGIYLSIVLVHFYAVAIVEDTGFGNTWTRCFYLVKDEWWKTFALYIVAYMVTVGITMVFYIPTYIVMVVQMISVGEEDPEAIAGVMTSFMSFVMPFYYLLSLLISLIYAVVSTMKYYSLTEQKDGSGERELIGQL